MDKKELSTEDMQIRIKSYQKHYPGKDLFFTADGNCFLKKDQADAHAKVEKIKVIELLAEKPKAKETDTEITEDKAKEILATLELNDKANYKLLGSIVEALGLEIEGKSKQDYITALTLVQDQLKEA